MKRIVRICLFLWMLVSLGTVTSASSSGTTNILVIKPEESGKVTVRVEGDLKADIGEDDQKLVEILIRSGYLTEKDLERLSAEEKIQIILTVEDADDTITEASKKIIASKLDGYQAAKYLDITLELLKFGKKSEIHHVSEPISMKIQIPETILQPAEGNRSYRLIRNHEGTAEILNTQTGQNGQVVIFQTDRFSDYAICYKDSEKKPTNPDNGEQPVGPGGSGNTENVSGVRTGDESGIGFWLMLCIVSLLILSVCVKHYKERMDDRI